jgi:3-hydroxyisobutyrate dehydrogenase-like beta-hydroxyacid dehydrogenase
MEKVGMVGVGAMGSALLERLKLAGVQATVYDSYAPSLEAARSIGAKTASSAAALARESTLIDVVVRTDQDVLDCMTGKDGVLEGARAGALVLLHSTILPQTTLKVAEAAGRHGVHVIDACMLGVPRTVRAGNLNWVVGGPKESVERARPHLLMMGKQMFHMGPLGAGNVGKLMKNLVTGSETLIVHEAIQIGEAAGIPYREALEMMRQTSGESVLNRWQERFDPSGASSTPRAGTNIFDKDIPLAAELARKYGRNLPVTEQLAAAGRRLLREKTP